MSKEITVKQLIELLQAEHPDKIIDFGGLEFYRLKDRGDIIHFEFSQSVYVSQGKVIVENHRDVD